MTWLNLGGLGVLMELLGIVYWQHRSAGGAGGVGSWLKTEEAGGVMDCHDMDFFTNESVYDSIRSLGSLRARWGHRSRERHGQTGAMRAGVQRTLSIVG